MWFFGRIIGWFRQRTERCNEACGSMLDEVVQAIEEIDSFFARTGEFLDPKDSRTLYEKQNELRAVLAKPIDKDLKKANSFREFAAVRDSYNNKILGFYESVSSHNKRAAEERLPDAYNTVGTVEGHVPDEQQMLCALRNAHSHLVIAGAGTGKTTTIVGKIKFLLRKQLCGPEDILVLSFTSVSAAEMRARIKKETGHDIEAVTFHKLGMDIIRSCEGISPKVTRIRIRLFVKEILPKLTEDAKYARSLSDFLLYHNVIPRSEFDFSNESEYNEYLKRNPPVTFRGEHVKSYGELDIANFLSQNGIEYVYEMPYPEDTRSLEYGQYHPDFFLPEYNAYIEYFATDKNGNVPAYFAEKNGESASVTYGKSIEWKRRLHAEYGTGLIECFAHEKFSGTMLDDLETRLKYRQIEFHPVPPDRILEELLHSETVLDGFAELAETTINLMKSNDRNVRNVRESISRTSRTAASCSAVLDLIEPIYDEYQRTLLRNGEIDFSDMIIRAAKYVAERTYRNGYAYVIVDEYQDLSNARYSLLKAVCETSGSSLFCVGDDWQSIYRFAGSDIGFILNFERYWGPSEIGRIETTFRFPQTLVDISNRFVMKNPDQIRKSIRGIPGDASFPLDVVSAHTGKRLAEILATRLYDLPKNSSVFLIGRYNSDVDLIRNDDRFSCAYDNEGGRLGILFEPRSDLRITFMTAHRSKGLQADHVFIIINKTTGMGFPSKIQDHPVVDLLTEGTGGYPYAEERRLFYVAMTRAKKHVTLLTRTGDESEFVAELRNEYGERMILKEYVCPVCGGALLRRSGPYSDFLGCSNYGSAGCTYKHPAQGMNR